MEARPRRPFAQSAVRAGLGERDLYRRMVSSWLAEASAGDQNQPLGSQARPRSNFRGLPIGADGCVLVPGRLRGLALYEQAGGDVVG